MTNDYKVACAILAGKKRRELMHPAARLQEEIQFTNETFVYVRAARFLRLRPTHISNGVLAVISARKGKNAAIPIGEDGHQVLAIGTLSLLVALLRHGPASQHVSDRMLFVRCRSELSHRHFERHRSPNAQRLYSIQIVIKFVVPSLWTGIRVRELLETKALPNTTNAINE
jgi:hypothetical protein